MTDKVRSLKKVESKPLDPEQLEIVICLRGLLEEALHGKVIGLVGLSISSDPEDDPMPVISGGVDDAGDIYMGLHNVADMFRLEHMKAMLEVDDDEEPN